MTIIEHSDLVYMAKYEPSSIHEGDEKICEQFLKDEIVTDKILELYVIGELEAIGDMMENPIFYKYENILITGEYIHGDYPANILSIEKQ